jgi:hypothetical protein
MSPTSSRAFSRPVFDQTITIHSNHAQRVLDRDFQLVVRALYGIDVVLRILGDDEEMDQVEEIVSGLIGELAAALRAEMARLAELRESNAISATPRYTNPREVSVHISSPQLAQYTALVEELDRLMIAMDTLWLTGVLTNKQRARGAYDWRTRLLRTGRRIIEIERRARASAEKRGKTEKIAATEAEGGNEADAADAAEVESENSEIAVAQSQSEATAGSDKAP